MALPLLQIALDDTVLENALSTAKAVADGVDIIEAGTILCVSEGVRTVSLLRSLYKDKIIVCDLKVADAGDVLARKAFGAGASYMTVICAAPIATMVAARQVADDNGGEIQIELFGAWTFDDARQWLDNGIRQAIYHRGRDAERSGVSWSSEDLDKMKRLSDLGIELSVTGGIKPQDIHLFKDINVKAFIAGRSIARAADPLQACNEFKEKFREYFKA